MTYKQTEDTTSYVQITDCKNIPNIQKWKYLNKNLLNIFTIKIFYNKLLSRYFEIQKFPRFISFLGL